MLNPLLALNAQKIGTPRRRVRRKKHFSPGGGARPELSGRDERRSRTARTNSAGRIPAQPGHAPRLPRCRRDTVLRRAEAGHLPPSNTAGRSERSDRRERPFEGTRGDHHPAYDLQPDSAAPDCGGGRGRASAPRAATHLPPAPGPRGGAAAATFSCPRWTCIPGRLSASQGPNQGHTCPRGIPRCAVPCPPCLGRHVPPG